MTAALYDLHGVERSYDRGGTEVRALRGVTVVIGAGEVIAVEGPSGSGKSTLLQLLGALDTPTAGTVTLEGKSLESSTEAELTDLRSDAIGFVFQQFNLIPTLTAAENIEIAMVPRGVSKAARKARAVELLGRVGLADRAEHLPTRLSGGEQQRVAIARALANKPRVVLADEPTGNLDSDTAGEIVSLLTSLAVDEGVTVIIVTHDEEVASKTGRRIRLRNGEVVSDSANPQPSPPSEVL